MQNRAVCVFLGVGKYTPEAALNGNGEMGWEPSIVKQWICIRRFLVRASCITTSRINKQIALWASHKASSQCKNWFYVVRKRFLDLQVNNNLSIHQAIGNNTVQNLRAAIMNEFKKSRFESVHNPVGWLVGCVEA